MIHLPDKQREIATLLLAGSERRSIAQKLGMSSNTLQSNIAAMRRRLGAQSDAQMMSMLREATRHPVEVVLEQCRKEPRQWHTI